MEAVPKLKTLQYSTVKEPRPPSVPTRGFSATFTSKPPSTRSPFLLSEKGRPRYVVFAGKLAKHQDRKIVVEVRGLEPLTPYLQNRCSAN